MHCLFPRLSGRCGRFRGIDAAKSKLLGEHRKKWHLPQCFYCRARSPKAERMASAPTSFTIPLGVIFKTARFLSNRIGKEMRRDDQARLAAKAAIFRCFPAYESVPFLWRSTGSILKTAFNKRAYPQILWHLSPARYRHGKEQGTEAFTPVICFSRRAPRLRALRSAAMPDANLW
jgi:hypothetical protein